MKLKFHPALGFNCSDGIGILSKNWRVIGAAALTSLSMPLYTVPSFAASASAVSPTKVILGKTLVSGVDDGTVVSFKGIPYAAPPVGDLRWKPPAAFTADRDQIDASSFGPDCAQNSPYPESLGKGSSEDCLYLNIWTPKAARKPLPVIVFIHGGGFEYGSGAIPMYDGTSLARRDVLVVNFNYRLGIFGFLAHSGLSKESPRHVSGNYGLLDQIAALTWVKKNIRAFGGDPSRVTLMGQSAGSRSVSLLMTSPLANGLFEQVILQSGAGLRHVPDLHDAEQKGDSLGSLNTLRAKSTDELLALSSAMKASEGGLLEPSWGKPVVDRWAIPRDQIESFKTGAYRAVPMILGTNANEGGAFVRRSDREDQETFNQTLAKNFGALAPQLATVYQTEDFHAAHEKLWTDMEFNLPAERLAALSSKVQPATYRYSFARRRNESNTLPVHGDELQYVFGTLNTPHKGKIQPSDLGDRALSEEIQSSWVSFAKTGHPDTNQSVSWPKYSKAKMCFVFDVPGRVAACPDVATIEKILSHQTAY
ncbi:carboxylesterase family protein [Paraburkholderia sediminicola]|uniref:carboxylesterase/lipase family protein n=1 Tax=Paraburkholderia sediminicola TaxID=458836 RepID=UPI0038BB9C57